MELYPYADLEDLVNIAIKVVKQHKQKWTATKTPSQATSKWGSKWGNKAGPSEFDKGSSQKGTSSSSSSSSNSKSESATKTRTRDI